MKTPRRAEGVALEAEYTILYVFSQQWSPARWGHGESGKKLGCQDGFSILRGRGSRSVVVVTMIVVVPVPMPVEVRVVVAVAMTRQDAKRERRGKI
jgi:hypothetical protein